MAQLARLACFVLLPNVGMAPCEYIPGIQSGSILIPHGKVFTLAEALAFQATFDALFTNDSRALRGFPIGPYAVVEPQNTDAVTETAASSGQIRTVRDAYLAEQFTIWGSKTYNKQLRMLNGKASQFDELKYDDKGQLEFIPKLDAAGQPGYGGYSLSDIFVGPYVRPNGSNGGMFTVKFSYSDITQSDRATALKLNFNPITDSLKLVDVLLSNDTLPGGTANTALVGATWGDRNDLTAYHNTNIAKPGAWDVNTVNPTTGVVGATVTPTAVATVPGVGFTFTFSTQTGNTLRIKLKKPSELAALTPPVLGIESNYVDIQIP